MRASLEACEDSLLFLSLCVQEEEKKRGGARAKERGRLGGGMPLTATVKLLDRSVRDGFAGERAKEQLHHQDLSA